MIVFLSSKTAVWGFAFGNSSTPGHGDVLPGQAYLLCCSGPSLPARLDLWLICLVTKSLTQGLANALLLFMLKLYILVLFIYLVLSYFYRFTNIELAYNIV